MVTLCKLEHSLLAAKAYACNDRPSQFPPLLFGSSKRVIYIWAELLVQLPHNSPLCAAGVPVWRSGGLLEAAQR